MLRRDTSRLTKRAGLALGFFFFLMVLGELRFLTVFQADNLSEWFAAARGVVIGQPHWRAYQNRLLGPHIIEVLAWLSGSYRVGFFMFAGISLYAVKALWCAAVYRLTADRRAAVYSVIGFSALFLLLQDRHWLYPWDFLDTLIFSGLAYCMWTTRRILPLVLLFFAALFNREAALFIPLWLVLDGVRFINKQGWFSLEVASSGKIAGGSLLLVGGAAVTKLVRDALFVTSHHPTTGLDEAHALIGNHIYFGRNLADFFVGNLMNLDYAFVTALIVGFLLLLARRWQRTNHQARVTVLLLVMLMNVFVFGLINETRMFLMFIPFVLLLLQDIPPSGDVMRDDEADD